MDGTPTLSGITLGLDSTLTLWLSGPVLGNVKCTYSVLDFSFCTFTFSLVMYSYDPAYFVQRGILNQSSISNLRIHFKHELVVISRGGQVISVDRRWDKVRTNDHMAG